MTILEIATKKVTKEEQIEKDYEEYLKTNTTFGHLSDEELDKLYQQTYLGKENVK